MKNGTTRNAMIAIVMLMAIIAGCKKQPTGCSDQATLDTVTGMVKKKYYLDDTNYAVSYDRIITQTEDKDRQGVMCTADIVVTSKKEGWSRTYGFVRYSSYLDDKGENWYSIKDFERAK